MKDLFDLNKYEIKIADSLLLELEVLGNDAKRDLVENGPSRMIKEDIGEQEYYKNELAVTTKIHGMMFELINRKMVLEHGDMVRMTNIGRVARRKGYEAVTSGKKSLAKKIKETNELISAVFDISVTTLKIIGATILLLAALGVVSVSSSTIELIKSWL